MHEISATTSPAPIQSRLFIPTSSRLPLFIGATLGEIVPLDSPANQFDRLVIERDADNNVISQDLWESQQTHGSDDFFFCKSSINSSSSSSSNNNSPSFPITCGCLNSGLAAIDPSFDQDVINSKDFTEEIYWQMINGQLPWPNCVEEETKYIEAQFSKIKRDEEENSEENLKRQANIKLRYEKRVAAREERIKARQEQRQRDKITMRTLKSDSPEVCLPGDLACEKRLRLKATRTCEGEYETYWKMRTPGKHCCHQGKFYLQYKIFMTDIEEEENQPSMDNLFSQRSSGISSNLDSNSIENTWAERQSMMNNIWQTSMQFTNRRSGAQGVAEISGIEGLIDGQTLDQIDAEEKNSRFEGKLAAVCLAGKVEFFDEKIEKRCSRVKEVVINKIKDYNAESPERAIEIWDHEKANPNKLYMFDEQQNIIIKKALTLVCPEGYHFEAEKGSQKRYSDWTCGGGTGNIKAIFPKCTPDPEYNDASNNQDQGSAFLNDDELGALLDESSHVFGAIDTDDFLQFVMNTNPDLAQDLQYIEPADEEDLGISERILGGVRVPTQDNPMYPWQVFLDMHERGFCGGVVLTERLFFTAAHCIKAGNLLIPEYRRRVRAYVGITSKEEIERGANGNEYTLIECKIHADYRISSQIMQNDIAYCIVDRNFDFSGPDPKVAPACLPDRPVKNYRSTECYATGFGTTGKYFSNLALTA